MVLDATPDKLCACTTRFAVLYVYGSAVPLSRHTAYQPLERLEAECGGADVSVWRLNRDMYPSQYKEGTLVLYTNVNSVVQETILDSHVYDDLSSAIQKITSRIHQTRLPSCTSLELSQLAKLQTPVLVLVHSPYCVHCKDALGMFEVTARQIQDTHEIDLLVADVEARNIPSGQLRALGIEAFPTVLIWYRGQTIQYKGSSDVNEWVRFAVLTSRRFLSVHKAGRFFKRV